jgi:hypothetical protein
MRQIGAAGARTMAGSLLHGNAGHFGVVRVFTLDEWKRLGEPGQLLAGLKAGFTAGEIARKRQWSVGELRRYLADAQAYLERRAPV